MTILLSILLFILAKVIWVIYATFRHGSRVKEQTEIVRRANYLISKVATSPKQLMDAMPKQIPPQFQGEWAIYSCSMTCKALANIAALYPQNDYKEHISKIINIVMSVEIRGYDAERWDEDPFEGIDGDISHLSYYSHLAWMIGEYKLLYNDTQFDTIYHSLCRAMYKRISNSPILNIPTYPYEQIYIPDMLVAIVALNIYSKIYDGKYQDFVQKWMDNAKKEWTDKNTGLLASFMSTGGAISPMIKGSYSALNCYYLSLIDIDFAKQQFQILKKYFKQTLLFITGIKEYHTKRCLFGSDIDAGPIVFGLSPSGTAFALGAATMCNDSKFRKQLLKTAEIAGSTVSYNGKSHYLLANVALVGEAIMLAMRTTQHGESSTH
jgi:hypothetical protein